MHDCSVGMSIEFMNWCVASKICWSFLMQK